MLIIFYNREMKEVPLIVREESFPGHPGGKEKDIHEDQFMSQRRKREKKTGRVSSMPGGGRTQTGATPVPSW